MKGLDLSVVDRELKREIFKYSYYEFFKFCFRLLFPNEPYIDSLHVRYLCDILQAEVLRIIARRPKDKDLIINIPPRSSKSLIGSICLLPWAWIHDPTLTFICVSFDDELKNLNSNYSKDIIKNDEYQKLFGHLFYIRRDSDAKGFWMNNHGGFRLSKTTGENITGHKAIIILVDDPQNPLTSESEAEIKFTVEYYTKSLFNRLTPPDLGIRVLIQQRLSEVDLTGYLLENHPEGHNLISLPAELLTDAQPTPIDLVRLYKENLLDPVRLNRKVLLTFAKVLGSRGYAGQYKQQPFAAEGNIIMREWLPIVEASTLTRDVYSCPIHFWIDGAYTEKTENDPSAILGWYFQDGFMYIVGVEEVWMNFPNLCKFIVNYVNQFEYSRSDSKIYVEPKASGKDVVAQLLATTNLNIIEGETPKDDKVARVHAITPKLEAKRVRLVKGHWNSKFIQQALAFPTGQHDDMVDCLSAGVKIAFNDNFDMDMV